MKSNFIMGVATFVIFLVLIVSLWDLIYLNSSIIGNSLRDVWSQFVMLIFPFVMFVAGLYGIYKIFKGRY